MTAERPGPDLPSGGGGSAVSRVWFSHPEAWAAVAPPASRDTKLWHRLRGRTERYEAVCGTVLRFSADLSPDVRISDYSPPGACRACITKGSRR